MTSLMLLTKTIKFFSQHSINDDDFNLFTISTENFEFEISNDDIKSIIIKEGYFTEENNAFVIKPSSSTVGSILETKPILIGSQMDFLPTKVYEIS